MSFKRLLDEQMDYESPCHATPVAHPYRILSIDATPVLHSMKKTQAMVKLADFQSAFFKQIEAMVRSYNEVRAVLDNCLDQSLKNKTRQKRAVSSTEFKINLELKLPMSLKDILSYTR